MDRQEKEYATFFFKKAELAHVETRGQTRWRNAVQFMYTCIILSFSASNYQNRAYHPQLKCADSIYQ